jgi:hypothetical protein
MLYKVTSQAKQQQRQDIRQDYQNAQAKFEALNLGGFIKIYPINLQECQQSYNDALCDPLMTAADKQKALTLFQS